MSGRSTRHNIILSDVESDTVDGDLQVGLAQRNDPLPNAFDALADRPRPNESTGKGSAIWDHFVKIDPNRSKCNYCSREFSTKYGTTTSLSNHLECRHSVQYAKFIKEKAKRNESQAQKRAASSSNRSSRPTTVSSTARPQQQTVKNAFQKQIKMSHDNPVAKKITRKIAQWIASDLQPFSVVEERGFVEVMQEARSDYAIPSRTTFSRKIVPELYADTQQRVQLQLTNCAAKAQSISFTSDIWTCRANKSYISLTCHFMDENFEMVSVCLGNSHFPGAHTAHAIYTKLIEMMAKWEGLEQLGNTMPMFMITDNAKNYVAAVRDNWEALSCFAHTLQLAISDAKKTNEPDVIKKVRQIVTHYNHSPKAYSRLQEFQEQMQLPTHTLPQDVPTRWNSEHFMLKRVFEQKNAIAAELGSSASRGTAELLSPAEWQVVDGLVKVLEPFAEATAISSGNVYPTRSMVIPLIIQLKAGLATFTRNPANQGHGLGFARNLEKSLHARFPLFLNNREDTMSMVLDPRFKDRMLDAAQKNNVRTKLERQVAQTPQIQIDNTGINQYQADAPQPHLSLWGTFDIQANEEQLGSNDATTRQQEIVSYLMEPVLPRTNDPLLWWRKNQARFPTLAKLAKCFLPIPATQVASERQFSAGSNTVTSRRERLTPLNVEMLVFLNQNLK